MALLFGKCMYKYVKNTFAAIVMNLLLVSLLTIQPKSFRMRIIVHNVVLLSIAGLIKKQLKNTKPKAVNSNDI